MKKISLLIIFLNFISFTYAQSFPVDAPIDTNILFTKPYYQIQVYADSIDYDSDENIVAKGNVKIIKKDEILTSDLVIINQSKNIITLPKEFQYKDDKDNYWFGTSGEFSTDFVNAKVNDIKILLKNFATNKCFIILLLF